MDAHNKIAYSLKEILIKNFRGIKHATLSNISEGTPWIFLTGRNGYGKTCLLQAIYLALYGRNFEGSNIIETEDFEIVGTIETDFGIIEHRVRNKNSDTYSYKKIPIVAFGPSRLSIQSAQSSNVEQEKSAKYYSLFKPDGVLLNIENELKNWFYRSESKSIASSKGAHLGNMFDNTVKTLLQLMPNIDDIKVDPDSDKVIYLEKDFENVPIPEKRSFLELASGNRSIIAMFGDMIIRLFRSQENITDPSDLEGIVIIDEIDLHLHPEWQKKLPGLLTEIFPKIQFIASTHSPIPFLGAPEGSIFLKVNRTAEEGISIEQLEIDIKNLTPNLILSSPIFGFTEVFPITHEKGARIRTEDTMQEVKQEDDLLKDLKSFLGKDKEKELKKLLKP